LFNDPSVLQGVFTTDTFTWNASAGKYSQTTTQYYSADCQTVFL